MNKYQDLNIWKRSVALATEIYKITSHFPKEEKFGLISQMRRCVVSVSSNIAEGAGRSSDKGFQYFIDIAYGSICELETQLIIAYNLNFIAKAKQKKVGKKIDEIQKMIYAFSKSLDG